MSSLTPHGEGFSFLDKFEMTPDPKRGRGTKWLDPQLPFFADHFPGRPLMPAVLLIECAAQAAGALWATHQGVRLAAPFVLAQVLQFKILHSVLPGESVETEVTLETEFGNLAQFAVVLKVSQREVALGRVALAHDAARENVPKSG